MDVIETIQDVICLTLFGTEILEMADDLSQFMFSFANYSNFYAVVTILLCFVTTAVLILRFNNDLLHFPVMGPLPPNTAVKQSMTGYTNPFSVQLTKASSITLREGFTLSVSSLTEGHLAILWGPRIHTLHEVLQWSAQRVLDSLTSGQLLSGCDECLRAQFDIRLEKDKTKVVHIDCPEGVDGQILGYSPRQRYPCVVVAAILDLDEVEAGSPAVIANFTVIHLRDSVVAQESQVVGQYLKLSDDRVYNLQPVFLATDHDSSKSAAQEQDPENVECDSTNSHQQERESGARTSGASVDVCSCDGKCDSVTSRLKGEVVNRTKELCNTVGSKDEDGSAVTTALNTSPVSGGVVSHSCESGSLSLVCESSSISQESKLSETSFDRFGSTSAPSRTSEGICAQMNTTDSNSVSLDGDLQSEMVHSKSSVQCSDSMSQLSGSVDSERKVSHLPRNISQTESDTACADDPGCVVCQMNAISHVILPCRHACVCGLCFKKIDRCPMCRGYIDTYFTLFDDTELDTDVTENLQTDIEETGFIAWVYRLNDRLNEYLGFT